MKVLNTAVPPWIGKDIKQIILKQWLHAVQLLQNCGNNLSSIHLKMCQQKRQQPHPPLPDTMPFYDIICGCMDSPICLIQQTIIKMLSEGRSYPAAENHSVSAIRLILFYTYFLSPVCSSPMNVFDSSLHAIWIPFLVIFYAESAYLPRKNKKFSFFIKRILIFIITGKTILSTETAPFLYDSVDFLTKRQHFAAYTKVLLTFINKKGIFKWYISFKYSSCLSTICYKIIN